MGNQMASSPSASPSSDGAAADRACDRYGLQLVEEKVVPEPQGRPAPRRSRDRTPLRLFHWGLLAGLGALQVAYLAWLALCLCFALRRLFVG